MLAAYVFLWTLVSFIINYVASEKAVICYYGTWATYRQGLGKYDVDNIDPNLCSHLIYTFVGIDDNGNIKSLDPGLDFPGGRDFFRRFNALKQKNSRLKTLLAVGGWNEGSAKYSVMAASAALRKNFIDSALKMITQYGFDGLDIDWEYPNRRDTVHGKADIDNFTTLLKETRKMFDKHGLLLTAAVSATRVAASQSYDIPAISQYLDIINIMTYDMNGAWDPFTGHNAPLHKGAATDLFTVDQALDYWITAGGPPEKLAVGVPFYGRSFTLRNSNVNGVRAPASGAGIAGPYTATNGILGYNEFCNMLKTEPWTLRYDKLAKVPYAHKNKDWVSYDDANSIASKIEYARALGINKVMIWSIETDDFHGNCGKGKNPLLNAINSALDNSVTSSTPSSTANTESSTINPSTSSTIEDGSAPSSIATKPTTSSSPPTITTSLSPSSTSSPKLICTGDVYVPNPDDCTSFYVCTKTIDGGLTPKKFTCPSNLYWDQTILACNHSYLVECNV